MKKEFLVAAPNDQKGGTKETRVTENAVFNPFKNGGEREMCRNLPSAMFLKTKQENTQLFSLSGKSRHPVSRLISVRRYVPDWGASCLFSVRA